MLWINLHLVCSHLPCSWLIVESRITDHSERSPLGGWYKGEMGGNMLCADCDYLCWETCRQKPIVFVSCYESDQMAD